MVSFRSEKALHKKGFSLIAGVDEAGRGPLAGPVVSAAVILPKNFGIIGLDNSKKLSPKRRQELYGIILKKAVDIGIGIAGEAVVDKINILNATLLSMKRAVLNTGNPPDFILVDGNKSIPGINTPQKTIIGGDGICASIAAASIIAKVTRDKLMMKISKKYPQYSFNEHKGYGTKKHFEALAKYGPCPVHRRSFAPVSLVTGPSL
ncbi:MAG: ribonuclease HII [Candidatus Saganbacteria bacterium]|nr:ribonuclease HII [Candidatus Saganbacteria bacterium]